MKKKEKKPEFDKQANESKPEFILRLYITGATPNSLLAISNIKLFCESKLKGKYSLEIIDLYQQPALAKDDQIIAVPLLIKKTPLPERRFIGDMSDTSKIIKSFGLHLQ